MSRWLLLITLGPIQDFIKEARRTRDLWFGSHALSELSRAAANAVAAHDGKLIFPALAKGDLELDSCWFPLRPKIYTPPISVANKIQAIVEGDPRLVAEAARKAVYDAWSAIADDVKSEVAACIEPGPDTTAIWNEQVRTLIEFYATWTELGDAPEEYAKARQDVERSLAARKNLRDFAQWKEAGKRKEAPKSSLDGARVSVLPKDRKTNKKAFTKYRISPNEQLDAVGLIKRAGFEPGQFAPIMNVAAAPWLKAIGANPEMQEALDKLGRACAALDLGRIERNLTVSANFRYDASVFYPDRWRSLFEEINELDDATRSHLQWGRANVQTPILDRLKPLGLPTRPSSYVACLRADGDHMGKTLDELAQHYGSEAHREFSRKLGQFPIRAREIVEDAAHLGSLVYSGGDDVVAFLPVASAVDCAEALQRAFKEIMAEALKGRQASAPTLSVGVGVGHVLESMGTLLDLGHKAEKAAKNGDRDNGDRNALAILFDKRSGGMRSWTASWDANPVVRLSDDVKLLGGALSTGKIYEIGAMLRRFRGIDDARGSPAMLDAFLAGLLAQSGAENGRAKATLADLELDAKARAGAFGARLAQLQDMTTRLLIAKELRANGWRGAASGGEQ